MPLNSKMKGRTIFVMQKGIRAGFFFFPVYFLFKKDCDTLSYSVE